MHRILLALLLVLLAGCATRTEERLPSPSDIVGKFVGDDGSYFVFSPDKKVAYHAIPAVWENPNANEEEVVSGSGDWRLEKDMIVVTVRDDKDGDPSSRSERRIVAFDVQGWFGLFLEIPTGPQSGYALYYVPPEKRERPNQSPQRNAGSRLSSGDSSASETSSSLGPRG